MGTPLGCDKLLESNKRHLMFRSLSFERWMPAGLGILIFLVSLAIRFELPDETRKELLSATISVSAILAGFLGTAKAILMALPQDGLPKKLRDSGYITDLAHYLAEALHANLGLCVVSIGGFLPLSEFCPIAFAALWAGLAALAVASFWRVSRIMLVILQLDPSKL